MLSAAGQCQAVGVFVCVDWWQQWLPSDRLMQFIVRLFFGIIAAVAVTSHSFNTHAHALSASLILFVAARVVITAVASYTCWLSCPYTPQTCSRISTICLYPHKYTYLYFSLYHCRIYVKMLVSKGGFYWSAVCLFDFGGCLSLFARKSEDKYFE